MAFSASATISALHRRRPEGRLSVAPPQHRRPGPGPFRRSTVAGHARCSTTIARDACVLARLEDCGSSIIIGRGRLSLANASQAVAVVRTHKYHRIQKLPSCRPARQGRGAGPDLRRLQRRALWGRIGRDERSTCAELVRRLTVDPVRCGRRSVRAAVRAFGQYVSASADRAPQHAPGARGRAWPRTRVLTRTERRGILILSVISTSQLTQSGLPRPGGALGSAPPRFSTAHVAIGAAITPGRVAPPHATGSLSNQLRTADRDSRRDGRPIFKDSRQASHAARRSPPAQSHSPPTAVSDPPRARARSAHGRVNEHLQTPFARSLRRRCPSTSRQPDSGSPA